MTNRAYKYRIYPNKQQAILIQKTFGCTRLVYNTCLASQIQSYNECSKMLTELKKEKKFLKEVDSISLQQSLRHLDTAYKNHFRDPKVGLPQFKSKMKSKKSYSTVCVNHNMKINDNSITLPKLGHVKAVIHRSIPDHYILKSATVSQEPSGEYYVSILLEFEDIITDYLINEDNSIGLDFSMSELYIDSEGYSCQYPRFFRKLEKNLAREQCILARRKEQAKKRGVDLKDAKNYQKQKIKVASIYQRIKNQRKDFLHKKSRELVDRYDVISIEDLNMQGMSQALHFGKSVSDNGWGMFTRFLEYKLESVGKQLIKIGRYEPSSKLCHVCGYENQDLTLATREWQCPICHTTHDRDINAAINIKKIGLTMLHA